jgi:hypothetical protein
VAQNLSHRVKCTPCWTVHVAIVIEHGGEIDGTLPTFAMSAGTLGKRATSAQAYTNPPFLRSRLANGTPSERSAAPAGLERSPAREGYTVGQRQRPDCVVVCVVTLPPLPVSGRYPPYHSNTRKGSKCAQNLHEY